MKKGDGVVSGSGEESPFQSTRVEEGKMSVHPGRDYDVRGPRGLALSNKRQAETSVFEPVDLAIAVLSCLTSAVIKLLDVALFAGFD